MVLNWIVIFRATAAVFMAASQSFPVVVEAVRAFEVSNVAEIQSCS